MQRCVVIVILLAVLVVPVLAVEVSEDDDLPAVVDAVAADPAEDAGTDEELRDFLSSLQEAFSEMNREEEEQDPAADSDYMPPAEFLSVYGDDYSIELYAIQTTPTSPVTASGANGFKKVVLSLFGDYSPVITQYRYQSNTSSNYTYVNDIQLDYPWLASAAIFTVVLYCCIRLGAAILCRR